MIKNYYLLLGIEKNASPLEIKEAYRKLCKKIHPDLNQGEAYFENYFKEVKEAYETLSDRYKKRMYDIDTFLTAGEPEEKVSGYSKIFSYPKTKILELKLTGLEKDLREQTDLLAKVEAERETLDQKIKEYITELAAAENYQHSLQSEIKHLQEYKAKQETEEKDIALALKEHGTQLQEQQSLIAALELEKQRITADLQQHLTNRQETEASYTRQLSALEANIQEQEKLITAARSEKQALQQRLNSYQQELTETSAGKTELQAKIQKLEEALRTRTATENLPPPTPVSTPETGNPKNLHRTLEKEKAVLKEELAGLTKKLAEAEKVKNNYQHKLEELALHKASQEAKEKQVLSQVAELEKKIQEQQTVISAELTAKQALEQELEKYLQELLAATEYKSKVQAQLQELEKAQVGQQEKEHALTLQLSTLEAKLQEQQEQLATALTQKNNLAQELAQNTADHNLTEKNLQSLISEQESKLQEQEKLLVSVQAENKNTQTAKQALEQELEKHRQELLAATEYKSKVQAQLQELEKDQVGQQEKEQALTLQLSTLEAKLQEQQEQLATALTQKNNLAQELAQNTADHNLTEKNLQSQIAELEEKLAAQKEFIATVETEREALNVSLTAQAAELLLANSFKESLQNKIEALEQQVTLQASKEKKLTASITALEAKIQPQVLVAVAPDTMATNREWKKPKGTSAATNKVKPEITSLATGAKEADQTQRLKEDALQREMEVLKAKLAKVVTEQPFVVEAIDFYINKEKEEFGHAFAAHKIKYLFPRLRIIMLAEQVGQLKIFAKYIKPNGELDFDMRLSPRGYSFSETIDFQPEQTYLYLAGWGTDKENNFAVGEHTLELYTETGRQIGKAKFTIVKKLLRFTEMFQK